MGCMYFFSFIFYNNKQNIINDTRNYKNIKKIEYFELNLIYFYKKKSDCIKINFYFENTFICMNIVRSYIFNIKINNNFYIVQKLY